MSEDSCLIRDSVAQMSFLSHSEIRRCLNVRSPASMRLLNSRRACAIYQLRQLDAPPAVYGQRRHPNT
jgi:hypothetical protein